MPATARHRAAALFSHPHLQVAGVFAPRGRGVSETLNGADGQPPVLSVLFDRAQVRLLNNWHSVGLCGTGSGEFEVEAAFVPADRCASLSGAPHQPGVLYLFPVFGLLALGFAAVASGMARPAIDALFALASDKVLLASSKTLAQRTRLRARSRARGMGQRSSPGVDAGAGEPTWKFTGRLMQLPTSAATL